MQGPPISSSSAYPSFVRMILKPLDFSKRAPVEQKTSLQRSAGDGESERGFLEASLELSFLLMSCHAMTFRWGGRFFIEGSPGRR